MATDDTNPNAPGNLVPVERKPGTFGPGYDPRRSTTGGRPRAIREIEAMLDAEHRNVANMRETFAKLRRLAVEGTLRPVYYRGEVVGTQREYHADFMALYLNRVLGPIKEPIVDEEILEIFEDAPPGFAEHVLRKLSRDKPQ